ncbi:SusC/RagA family TonB-linked outer membrane protein [Carboxylicivirga sp. A043]|uniref:SusC/RagA family TonB-linked outer membrane protein n=1 Tax=Carboxylicivirga litoralis TaxID=2816963 RepID=UPI0021CB35B1|nr:SusC/RagA family TonB-linked outer membrane protein [Carboxylicivirga sp. A043]MCU4156859.1 SusC/RagA family TonB-linked outer membrane protein [Carboxylicivirga sp. A043]
MRRLALIASLILFVGLNAMFAQTTSITGTVTDSESGEPMPGVSVVVRGTTIGTVTNIDGIYTLSVPNDATNLLYSFVGMKTQDVLIEGRTTINVVLESEAIGVDEVVVMGYTTARKSEVTGSAVKVSGEDLANMPVADVQQALQGKVAGVSIASSSGTPGSVQNVRIRGRSSITAGNDPLYVVNGVPLNTGNASATTSGSSLSDLVSLNSNDIESITVLKDAAATAAYGARGANGVIVITTKTGKSGKADINFSATYGVSNDAMDGPGVLTGAEREMLFYEAIKNTWGLSGEAEAKQFYEDNPSTFGTDYVTWNAAGRPETDWGDLITNKNAPMQEYNLSASGGTDKMNYYTSVGYFNQEATVIGSDFERFSGNVNLTANLTDKLTFSTNNSAAHSYQDGLLETSAYFSSPRTSKFFMPSIDQAYNDDGSINYASTALPNPLWIAQEDIDDSKLTKIISNNALSWETPIKGLRLTSRMSIDYQVYNYKRYRNPLRGDGDGETKGYGWQAHTNRVNYVFQNSADYSFDLDGGHNLDLKALVEYQKNKFYYLEADADNFSDFGLTNLNSAGNPTLANSYFTDWLRSAYIGMIHYSYQGRYVLDVTYTREGSSRFHPDHRWGNFYGIGAAWNMHQESFMTGMDFISNFKLRASYGVTGNANISLNQYQSLLNYDGDYAGEGASYPGTFGNDELSWETSHTLDIGLDFGFLNNRISGAIGYYRRETKDMLLDVPLSLTTGFVEQTRNIGRMENKGIEFELDVDIIRSSDFNLSIGGNFGTAKNEVLELAKDLNGEEVNITSTTQRVETGHPVFGWYMPTWAGVNSETGDEMWYVNPNESDETTTNFNDAEQVWQGGSAIPEFVAGMNLHVDFKGFFADINGVYAGGHKIYEGWHRYTNGTDVFSVAYYQGIDVLLDRWQQPGDETRFGKFEYTGRPWQRHSKFLYDGDYFRLRDVTVGYDFPKSITDKIKLGGLRVFAKGLNLYTWVKDDNLQYDPETVDSNGETSLTTPAVKSFIFGVNVKF